MLDPNLLPSGILPDTTPENLRSNDGGDNEQILYRVVLDMGNELVRFYHVLS